MNLDRARAVADTVLYEGYLLYPYRASSSKNQARWQFGVLGPPGALRDGLGEDTSMSMQCLLDHTAPSAAVVVHLRFLQIQRRQLVDGAGAEVPALHVDGTTWLSWDEAVEQEHTVRADLGEHPDGLSWDVRIDGGEEAEPLVDSTGATAGTIVRRRWALSARVRTRIVGDGLVRLEISVDNTHPGPVGDRQAATRRSLLGAHLLVEAHGAEFVSLIDPPDAARDAAQRCRQQRCWPVLAGEPGDTDLLLGLPIIVYDYPEVAAESAGALFDATEIDEILTLRVLTMTDEEKAEARATDPRARDIIDRCDDMAPETLHQLHGILRSPHAGEPLPSENGDVPWWDPAADESVRPEIDAVTINGVSVAKGSLVRVHPNRRADAQDIFFAGQLARVTAVLSDVDGGTHVAVVLADDPAADLHDWYGRYLYFAADELEPIETPHREESRP
ncbi:MAG: hypothetical protein ABWX57_11200 [Aeromicrobium sp.]